LSGVQSVAYTSSWFVEGGYFTLGAQVFLPVLLNLRLFSEFLIWDVYAFFAETLVHVLHKYLKLGELLSFWRVGLTVDALSSLRSDHLEQLLVFNELMSSIKPPKSSQLRPKIVQNTGLSPPLAPLGRSKHTPLLPILG
jgi:hypothetical protein